MEPEEHVIRRKRRSHRTKTDACAGTTELSSGDVTEQETEKSTIATAVIRDLKIECSCSTQMLSERATTKDEKYTQGSKETLCQSLASQRTVSQRECEYTQTSETTKHPVPYLMMNEKRKLTRFQLFIQRIFGLRPEKTYRNYVLPNGHVYAASDNNIMHSGNRRRRRLRFRRLRRAKKVHSETALRDLRSPMILTYVQSVQKSCLQDTTSRQCPIVGCRMMFYGIINYNDHLNLCHFTDRKYICHYCHEGFEKENDKYVHENEHIGITKLNFNNYSTSTVRSTKRASNTQTDPQCEVPEEKLKKIVSFFDKIVDNDQLLNEIKKNRYSESNLQTIQHSNGCESVTENEETMTNSSSDKRTVSCGNLLHRKVEKSETTETNSDVTSKYPCLPVKCHFCGENFDYRRQLSLHMDLEHRVHDKFSKFHSCAGITNPRPPRCIDGKFNLNNLRNDRKYLIDPSSNDFDSSTESQRPRLRRVNTSSTVTEDNYDVPRRKSEETLSCDPSTNIIFYESMETINKKPSVVNNLVQKVRTGITSYKWEPGTKIIRV